MPHTPNIFYHRFCHVGKNVVLSVANDAQDGGENTHGAFPSLGYSSL